MDRQKGLFLFMFLFCFYQLSVSLRVGRDRTVTCGSHQKCVIDTSDSDSDSESKRWVVFSTDTQDLYFFFTPITTLLWALNMDYDPLIFVVVPEHYKRGSLQPQPQQGQQPQHNLIDYVLHKTEEAGGKVVLLHHKKGKEGLVNDGTVSQVARLYAAGLSGIVKDEDYLLTSDVDMFPLSRQHFLQGDIATKKVHLFYANAYAHMKDTIMYPLCYIGMKAKTWKEVMGITGTRNEKENVKNEEWNAKAEEEGIVVEELVLNAIEKGIERYGKDRWQNSHKQDGDVQWYFDQFLFGEKIASWPGHPEECQKIARYPFKDRLDRSKWNFNGNKEELDNLIDSHVVRPGFTEQNWIKLKQLLAILLPHHIQWLQEYKEEFLRLRKAVI